MYGVAVREDIECDMKQLQVHLSLHDKSCVLTMIDR